MSDCGPQDAVPNMLIHTLHAAISTFQARKAATLALAQAEAKRKGWSQHSRLKYSIDPMYRAEIETWDEAIEVLEGMANAAGARQGADGVS